MKYRVTHKNLDGYMLFEYDSNGVLKVFENHSKLSNDQGATLMSRFPITFKVLEWFVKVSKSKMAVVPDDLTFDRFWNAYNYKVGKKSRVEALWGALDDNDRMDVLNSIPSYNAWLRGRNIERVYPQTYLSQERWKNSYL